MCPRLERSRRLAPLPEELSLPTDGPRGLSAVGSDCDVSRRRGRGAGPVASWVPQCWLWPLGITGSGSLDVLEKMPGSQQSGTVGNIPLPTVLCPFPILHPTPHGRGGQ